MAFVGIDLSGPSNLSDTAVVTIDDDGTYRWHGRGFGDRDIMERLDAIEDLQAVGLDAPLSYNPGGGDRPAERSLRTALTEAGGTSSSVMPPTMTRMAYLTLRGISLARLLEHTLGLGPSRIVEVHPTSALVLGGAEADDVDALKIERAARRRIVTWLNQEGGLRGLPDGIADSDHLVAAASVAMAMLRWRRGSPAFEHPADPPIHPHTVIA